MDLQWKNRFETVPVAAIDADDRRFACSYAWQRPSTQLEESIRRAGVRTPLRLERGQGSSFRVVSGFRRLEVIRGLGIPTIPAEIETIDDPRVGFLGVVWENLGTREFHELEKALVVSKLASDFGVPEKSLIEEILPALGIGSTRRELLFFLKLAGLREPLQISIWEAAVQTETALKIASWTEKEQDLLLDFLKKCPLGLNKQRQLSELLDDLRSAKGISVSEIWEESGARPLEEDGTLSPDVRFSRIRSCLVEMRYPVMSGFDRRFSSLRKSLNLPPQIQFQMPRYFEGDRVSVSLHASSAPELRSLVERLKASCERPELEEIFALL